MRPAVRAVGDDRVVAVADRDDAGAERDLFRREPVGVAAAVQRSWPERTMPATPASSGAAAMMRSPIIVCWRMYRHSSSVSARGACRIESGSPPCRCRAARRRAAPRAPRHRRAELARDGLREHRPRPRRARAAHRRARQRRAAAPGARPRRSSDGRGACSRTSADRRPGARRPRRVATGRRRRPCRTSIGPRTPRRTRHSASRAPLEQLRVVAGGDHQNSSPPIR